MSFAADLSRFQIKTEKQLKTVIRKITMEAFRGVVLRTPVDTGRARANWSPSIGSASTATSDNTDKSGSGAIATAQKSVFDWNCTGSIFLCNNLPYIGALEYGHSQQAPGGMVRLTVSDISAHYGGR
jgi:hypothetical protein